MKSQYAIYQKLYKPLSLLPQIAQKAIVMTYCGMKNKQITKLRTPKTLILYVTNSCNARCAHCFCWQQLNDGNPILTLDQIECLTSSLESRLDTLLITGGEPFLRQDLEEICDVFARVNKTRKINIDTNGSLPELIERRIAGILHKSKVELNLQVSLDGTRDIHDEIRGVQAMFSSVAETLMRLRQLETSHENFHVSLLTTLSKANIENLDDLLSYSEGAFPGIYHGFHFVRSAAQEAYNLDKDFVEDHNPRTGGDLMLSVSEMETLQEVLKKRRVGKDHTLLHHFVNLLNDYVIAIRKNKERVINCLAGRLDGVVYSDGSVALCEFTKPFANLQDFDFHFARLWNSGKAQQARQKIKACACTHSCHLLTSMKYDSSTIMRLLNLERQCAHHNYGNHREGL